MSSQVVRPHIPYRGSIPGGLHEGKLIEITGSVPYGADIFTINLHTGFDPSSDKALHISVRFSNRIVVRNHQERNTYGSEERHGIFPFVSGREFTLMILVDPSCYRIAVNSQHCWEFVHRIPYTRVSSISIDGSVHVDRIEFVDKINPYQPGICIPPSAGCHIPAKITTQGHIRPAVPATISTRTGPYPVPGQNIGSCIIAPPENKIGICPFPATGMQPSSNLAPVYNPVIPYAYPIYGGLKPGMMIYVSGRPSASAYRFSLNLQSGTAPYPPPDIAFHMDTRFYNRTVVRNSRTNNVWAAEESVVSHFPFQPAVNFDIIIRVEMDKYMVAVNGQHFFEFRHRLMPLARFDTLYIDHDVVVSSIRFA